MSLFQELKRRNVIRVGVAYMVASWVLLQMVDVVAPIFEMPLWVPKFIILTLAVGLVPVIIFSWAFEMTPQGIKREADVNRSESITNVTAKKLDYITIGLVIGAVLIVVVDRLLPEPTPVIPETNSVIPANAGIQTEASESTNLPANETPSMAVEIPKLRPPEKSIAVLPFINMSSDPEQEYFSDGISEEILNALARVKELKVAGRTSSFSFKGKDQDLRQIGETLGVQTILEGSVRKSGNTVRITAQLIQVEDGFHLWSDTYDRELDNVFAIQDEIATAILEQLKATLIGDDAEELAADRTNSEAYDLYLLAKQRMTERDELALQSAVALLDKAIVLDPDYAPAHAQRGITTLLLREQQYGSIPNEEAWAQSKLYIDKALSLDPGLAEANAALGLYHISRPQESELAIEPLQKALSVNPSMTDATNWLSSALGALGRVQESLALYEEVVKRDPFYRPGIYGAVGLFNDTGQHDQSWALIDRISPFFPEDPILSVLRATTFNSEGRPGDAIPLLESAMERGASSISAKIQLGVAFMNSGQYERAAEVELPFIKAWALFVLDRQEEASIITAKMAADGVNVSDHINYMVMTGKYKEALGFFEQRWSSFDAFEIDFPPLGIGSVWTYGDLAFAYGAVGNQERFEEAMKRYRTNLDHLQELGFQNDGTYFMEAVYFALADDRESALKNLGMAVDQGWLSHPRISKEIAQFKSLEGDPEYQAIQARMVQHMNDERAKLDLEPISI